MSSVAIRTLSVNEAIAKALRPWSAKAIARRVQTSVRAVENWKHGRTGPQAKHVAAILNDEELGPAFLTAIGRADLATRAELASLNQRIETLKAAEKQHKKEANEIRTNLDLGVSRVSLDGGAPQREGGSMATARRVVPRPSE